MIDKRKMRAWAEIDLDALAHNYHSLRAMLPQGCKFLGLVKADAYGHGAVPVAKKLERLGADMLAVACVAEARQLRQAGLRLPILCLGQTPVELADDLLRYDVTQAVEDFKTGEALSRAAQAAGKTLTIHVKLDTGMGRLGFRWEDGDNTAVADEMAALCALPNLRAEGMFTHFAAADGDEDYTMGQLTRFLDAKAALERRGVSLEIYHCGASAAVLHYPCTHFNMARPGIALYGHYPDKASEGLDGPGLTPVMTVKSRIAAVRSMPAGAKVSYGCTATLSRPSRVAVIPMGYGDGLHRALSNQLEVLIQGRPCPILGRICMDMCMADVTDLPDVGPGETVTIYGPGLTDRAAEQAGTISYELLCQITPRVPRIYLENGAEIGSESKETPVDRR